MRKPFTPPSGEKGAALLTVLLLVAVMAVISATALDRLRLSTRLAVNGAAMAQARAYTLAAEGIAVRVVSMPSTDVFDRQDAAYKAAVLGKGLPRIAIEAGVTAFWFKYVGLEGAVIGIDRFGESAPAGVLFKHFGFTTDKVVAAVKSVLH